MSTEPTSSAAFLVDEYLALWETHGIEGAARLKPALLERLRPAPAAALAADVDAVVDTVVAVEGEVVEEAAVDARPALPAPTEPPPAASLDAVRAELGDCRRCGLCASRRHLVFGEGAATARVLFVGDAPGDDEDTRGTPYVGAAGQLLGKIIEAMGLHRDRVYLTTLVKCRPPARAASDEEKAQCLPFLKAQLAAIGPEIVIALGEAAAHSLLGVTTPLAELRGRFHPLPGGRAVVMPTYGPEHLLSAPDAKKLVWEDMKQVRARCIS